MYVHICIYLCERRVKLFFEVNTSHIYMCICRCMYVNNLFTCMYGNNLFTCMYVNNLFNNLSCTMSVELTFEESRTRAMHMCICTCIYVYVCICT